MADLLTVETFSDKINEIFEVEIDAAHTTPLTLTEVTAGRLANYPEKKREPFSLFFTSNASAALDQKTYSVKHPTIGTFDLFLVPVDRPEHGFQYQAVFT